jgi:hypothetical protein
MQANLVLAVLVATLALGVVLGFLYLSRVRKPVLIGIHIILGVMGLEQVAMLLHGAPNGAGGLGGSGVWGPLLMASAMFFGLLAPSFAKASRRSAEFLLVTHALAGIAGFLVFLSWVRHVQPGG